MNLSIHRIFIVIFLSVSLFACASTRNKPHTIHGTEMTLVTTVPPGQIMNVIEDVRQWHDMEYPNCKYVSMVSAEIVNKEKDFTKEKWTVLGCEGKKFAYAVNVIRMAGGITDSVGNFDGSSMQVH
jgi:hypothetical protein